MKDELDMFSKINIGIYQVQDYISKNTINSQMILVFVLIKYIGRSPTDFKKERQHSLTSKYAWL